MIQLTETMYQSLVGIARHALKQATALTIRRDADPDLFDYVIRTMPDAELFEQAMALLIGPTPAAEPEPEPKTADPTIPKWIAEGEAAYRAGAPRTNSPGGRKDRHWLAGWDRAKAAHDADQPVSEHDCREPTPPARTPETAIEMEGA